MPTSISSKISVLIESCSANTAFMASIIRESSPPDAALPKGFKSSPGFVDNINSISSFPFISNSLSSVTAISNLTCKKFKSISASIIFFSSSLEQIFLIFDICFASSDNFSLYKFIFFSKFALYSPYASYFSNFFVRFLA